MLRPAFMPTAPDAMGLPSRAYGRINLRNARHAEERARSTNSLPVRRLATIRAPTCTPVRSNESLRWHAAQLEQSGLLSGVDGRHPQGDTEKGPLYRFHGGDHGRLAARRSATGVIFAWPAGNCDLRAEVLAPLNEAVTEAFHRQKTKWTRRAIGFISTTVAIRTDFGTGGIGNSMHNSNKWVCGLRRL